MKITADDWHFQGVVSGTLIVELYLDNGQHALLEVNPMKNADVPNGMVPEMIVFAEMPGERLPDRPGPGRWISRPPARNCAWSNVQLPQALLLQVQQQLDGIQPWVSATSARIATTVQTQAFA